MRKILLIQPPIQDFYITTKRTIPYGLAIMAGILKKQGLEVKILDCLATLKSRHIPTPPELKGLDRYYVPDHSPFALFFGYKHFGYTWDWITCKMQEEQPDLIAISSLFTAYSREALRVAQIAKEVCPAAIVVMGGHHVTVLPEAVMQDAAVDYCLRGEGEIALPALILALQNNTRLEDVPGIVMRQADGSLHINVPAVMENLEPLQLPALDCLDNQFYQRAGQGSVVIVASRGCCMHCSYCCVASGSWLRYRRRSVASVLEEIAVAVQKYQVRFIDFEDENISMDRAWFLELLHAIQLRYGNSLELRAMNGLYPPTLDEEVITEMAKAGFRALNLSLGTIHTQQLQRFHRPNVQAALERAVQCASHQGLSSVVYIIVAAPGQNPLDSVQDLLYLARLPVLIGTSIYYPAPGSQDYQTCQEKKLLPSHFSQMRSTALPISDTTTRLQAITLLRLTRIINFAKSLLDHGQDIPLASALDAKKWATVISTLSNTDQKHDERTKLGRFLLSSFLYNGKILGITPGSRAIFEHEADPELCKIVQQNFVING